MRQTGNNRGSTTLLILWMIGILSMIATFLIYRAESEWAATVNLERRMNAQRLAEEILHERLQLLIGDEDDRDTREDAWFNQTGISRFARDGYQVTVMIEDEGSKPNINTLTASQLALFADQSINFDALLDWIDPDSDTRDEGAERDYYLSQTPAYLPHDGFIASLSELLSIKNGQKIYSLLAPHCTVYGKWNPNTLTQDQFENLLVSSGFDSRMAEMIADDFETYRLKERFDDLDQFLKLNSISLQTLDKLKNLLEIKGHCNLNFIDEAGLKVLLKQAGYDPNLSVPILARRAEAPFESLDEALPYLKNPNNKRKIYPENYFTVVSQIFRIRIWLIHEKRQFYLETVQLREKGDDSVTPWKMRTLNWNFLNHDLPEIPKIKNNNEEDSDDSNN